MSTVMAFRRFAFIGGPDTLIQHGERLAWFQQAVKQHGLKLPDKLIRAADLTSTGGYQAAVELLSLPDPPEAIFWVNDETAFGVLHAAHEHDLEIGEQLAVAGFDGVQIARHSEPPLTTVDIPVFDIARQLVELLIQSVEKGIIKESVFIKPNLLVRPSTGG